MHRHNHIFVTSLGCAFIGLLVRLLYCIQYPVQPRDAFTYQRIILNWEESGKIIDPITFFPLSLFIQKIPYHFFHYDIIKGGVIVNNLFGLLIIIIATRFVSLFFKNDYALLFAGLVAATHPSLVRFSCSLLRENIYLFFFLLSTYSLSLYFFKCKTRDMVAASIFGAISFLCRLEGAEILPIFYIIILFLHLFGRIKFHTALKHGTIFILVFLLTVFVIINLFDFNTLSSSFFIYKFKI